ncbi:hypothetical protein GWO43_06610 [candidate division KSB1 bacterium]|nr:hypothetical protein [candidate division KSB1 bacterium]NIR72539.1 hypothetical protein [candidate division KSB1 bacterium]NIS23634.1 hypothetical protein [candidate division KSB1 bacterium]NIT70558.1 hypothetical protein [candidate division KSB1 bacterium]NIU24276.1 hypothetical protein [candidate division KSB1 bacterium]
MKITELTKILPFIMLFIFNCETNEPLTPDPQNNLIENPSFERESQFSLDAWDVVNPNLVNASNDAPVDGGDWSVRINADWSPEAFQPQICTTITLSPGQHKYTFTCWAKYKNISGVIRLKIVNPDTSFTHNSIAIQDTMWTEYTLSDTVTLSATDTLSIRLSGGFTHVVAGETTFDLCSFEITE